VPAYSVVATRGEAHAQLFEVECRIPALDVVTQGAGPSRRAAEQEAAALALDALAGARPTRPARPDGGADERSAPCVARALDGGAGTAGGRGARRGLSQRLRRHRRPPVGRQVDAPQRAGRRAHQHHLAQAADHAAPHRGHRHDPQVQFVFVDTPGFQTRHRSTLNDRLNRTVRESLADVDVVVWVVDAARVTAADEAVGTLVPAGTPLVIAVNKVDALDHKRELLPRLAALSALKPDAAIVPISAERGTQLSELKAEIARHLPLSPPLYAADELTDRDERFLAAELVREKIFRSSATRFRMRRPSSSSASSRRARCGGSTRPCWSTAQASARS
jgi:small GTP-binding protein